MVNSALLDSPTPEPLTKLTRSELLIRVALVEVAHTCPCGVDVLHLKALAHLHQPKGILQLVFWHWDLGRQRKTISHTDFLQHTITPLGY